MASRIVMRKIARSFSPAEVAGWTSTARHFSVTSNNDASYKLVVVGGGAGGCATAAKFCRYLGKGQVAIIEPSEVSCCVAFCVCVCVCVCALFV